MNTAVIRARIPEVLKKDFETAAAAHEMNLSQAVRVLMAQYVEQEKEVTRRHEETLEALEDIETGEIVDGDKVMSWLASWGPCGRTDNCQKTRHSLRGYSRA